MEQPRKAEDDVMKENHKLPDIPETNGENKTKRSGL